jgi:hypothetical protein
VSLSNKRVQQILNEKFICVWINLKDDPAAGASFAHKPSDPAPQLLRGNGEHNNQILLLTTNGEIINALAGFIGPQDLLEELKFGLNTLTALSKSTPSARKEALVKAHQKFAALLDARKPTGPLAEIEERMQKEISRLAVSLPSTGVLQVELPIGSKRGVLDHRFVMEHPLLDVHTFRTEMLVGNAQTFFGSSINGAPKQTIGNGRPADLPKK